MFQTANSARLLVIRLQLNLFQGVSLWMSQHIIITKKKVETNTTIIWSSSDFQRLPKKDIHRNVFFCLVSFRAEFSNLKPWWIHPGPWLKQTNSDTKKNLRVVEWRDWRDRYKMVYDIIPTNNWVLAENSQIYRIPFFPLKTHLLEMLNKGTAKCFWLLFFYISSYLYPYIPSK